MEVDILAHFKDVAFAFAIHFTLVATVGTSEVVERYRLNSMTTTPEWNTPDACIPCSFFLFICHTITDLALIHSASR